MRQLFRCALLSFLALSTVCAWGGSIPAEGVLQGFRGGPGEQTFGQAYGLKLPVDEAKLEAFLRAHGLKYWVSADVTSKATVISIPVWVSGTDLSHIVKVYDIYDPSKGDKHKAIHFFAYVDELGSVVYIENRYQYSGP